MRYQTKYKKQLRKWTESRVEELYGGKHVITRYR